MKHILKRPLVSEKNTVLAQNSNQYVFVVDVNANRLEIAQAVALRFGVEVQGVRTLQQRGKMRVLGRHFGKKSNWKKAFVTLKQGQKIELIEGL